MLLVDDGARHSGNVLAIEAVLRSNAQMLRYLRELTAPRIILWCYLLWYVGVLFRYFDGSPALWLSSLGIGAIVGTALYLSTVHAGTVKTLLGRWQVLRLFLMPFCVSSFAALIKGQGFVLIFYPELRDNLAAGAVTAAFVLAVVALKRTRQHVSAAIAGSVRAGAPTGAGIDLDERAR